MTGMEVVPYEGIGPFKLNTAREQLREMARDNGYVLCSSAESSDYFSDNIVRVDYDADLLSEFVEVSTGGELHPHYNGMSIFETDASEVARNMAHVAAVDEDDPEHGYSYTYPALQLSFWRPIMPEDDNDQEGRFFSTVAIAMPGYF